MTVWRANGAYWGPEEFELLCSGMERAEWEMDLGTYATVDMRLIGGSAVILSTADFYRLGSFAWPRPEATALIEVERMIRDMAAEK